MPFRPRIATAGNALHRPERESTPYWRRETSWKKYLDPRHPLTRLGLGILLSGVPVVGTTIIFLTLCYFGFAKKKGEWISGIAVAVVYVHSSSLFSALHLAAILVGNDCSRECELWPVPQDRRVFRRNVVLPRYRG